MFLEIFVRFLFFSDIIPTAVQFVFPGHMETVFWFSDLWRHSYEMAIFWQETPGWKIQFLYDSLAQAVFLSSLPRQHR